MNLPPELPASAGSQKPNSLPYQKGTYKTDRSKMSKARAANFPVSPGSLEPHTAPGRVRSRTYQKRESSLDGMVENVHIEGFIGGDLFRLTDSSMLPVYNVGEFLICTRARELADIASGSIVVLRMGGNYLLKRLFLVGKHVLIDSDNKPHCIRKIREEQIEGLWEVQSKLTPALLQKMEVDEDVQIEHLERDLRIMEKQVHILKKRLESD